jgi:uncharacterized protein (TIGR02118 family)
MIKLIFLMKRKEQTSLDEFKKWLVNEHVTFARELRGVTKYTVNPLIKDDPDALYDAVTELYFESETAMTDAFATEVGKAAGENVNAHCANTFRMLCEEKFLI